MPTISLERVVRPKVLPRIRPAARAPLQLADDEDSGVARITGGTQVINFSHSYNSTESRQNRNQNEKQRTFDLVRVKQKEADGTINEDNYVDVEVAHKLQTKNELGQRTKYDLAKAPLADNIEILEQDKTRVTDDD